VGVGCEPTCCSLAKYTSLSNFNSRRFSNAIILPRTVMGLLVYIQRKVLSTMLKLREEHSGPKHASQCPGLISSAQNLLGYVGSMMTRRSGSGSFHRRKSAPTRWLQVRLG